MNSSLSEDIEVEYQDDKEIMKNQIFIAKTGLRKKYVSLKRMQNQYIEQLEDNKDLIDLNPKY